MKDYLLVIDTEASGLPRKWNQPYSKKNNWPHCVQISWIIYNREGTELKREDHYISNDDFEISASAIKIHGITRTMLNLRGEVRREVLELLSKDLRQYQPLVIGHFIEFDYHVLAADYFREGMQNPITELELPAFCTMVATSGYVANPACKYLRLGDLYMSLFNRELEHPHNAIHDAEATAECFFELLRKGDISAATVAEQRLNLFPDLAVYKKLGWILAALLFILCILLVAYGFS